MDIQTFTESGTWTKPHGATYVDMTMAGAGGGGAFGADGQNGELTARRFRADQLPDQCEVTIGRGGRGVDGGGGGADGYAVIITHLTASGPEWAQERAVADQEAEHFAASLRDALEGRPRAGG